MIDWKGPSADRVEAMAGTGLWGERTVLDYLDDALVGRPDQVYLTDRNAMTGRSTTLSYRQIDRVSRRIAVGLAATGVGRGDVVALQLPNWWEFIAIHLACVRIGAVTNPLMPIFRERELRFMLAFAETRVLFIPERFRNFEYAPMIETLRPELPDLEHVYVLGESGNGSFEETFIAHRWEDGADAEALFAERKLHPNEIAELCYTSGTTGEPKAVMHTYNTLIACTEGRNALEFDEKSVCLMGSPLAHQTGFLFGMLLPILVGGRLVLMDVWDCDEAVRIVTEEQVTYTMGATVFLSDMTDSPLLEQFPTDSLEVFICGGAPIPRVLVQTANQRLGAAIAAGWGMSENGLVTVTRRHDSKDKVINTDGRPLGDMEVRIVDDDGVPVPNGVDGNLEVRGAANFIGYLKRSEAAKITDGWFGTGDIANLDDDGYIRITGRAKDLILRGGENVPVPEVEAVLYQIEAVQDVAVVAMPHARMSEKGCAFVTLHPGQSLSFEQMQAHMAQAKLAKTYWPERLEIVDEFPRTPSGKIQKFKLRQIATGLEAVG